MEHISNIENCVASLEATHQVLNHIHSVEGRTNLTETELALVRLNVSNAASYIGSDVSSLTPSLESDNFFEATDVEASMESIWKAIGAGIKAGYQAFLNALIKFKDWIVKLFSGLTKAKKKNEETIKLTEELKSEVGDVKIDEVPLKSKKTIHIIEQLGFNPSKGLPHTPGKKDTNHAPANGKLNDTGFKDAEYAGESPEMITLYMSLPVFKQRFESRKYPGNQMSFLPFTEDVSGELKDAARAVKQSDEVSDSMGGLIGLSTTVKKYLWHKIFALDNIESDSTTFTISYCISVLQRKDKALDAIIKSNLMKHVDDTIAKLKKNIQVTESGAGDTSFYSELLGDLNGIKTFLTGYVKALDIIALEKPTGRDSNALTDSLYQNQS